MGAPFAGDKVIALPPPPTPMRRLPRLKFAVARAQMLYADARAAVCVNRYWEELLHEGNGSLQTRRDIGLARKQSIPLGSLLRDAIVINQHLGFNDGVIERLGGMMMGDPPDGAFV